jgi:hypothetical protein
LYTKKLSPCAARKHPFLFLYLCAIPAFLFLYKKKRSRLRRGKQPIPAFLFLYTKKEVAYAGESNQSPPFFFCIKKKKSLTQGKAIPAFLFFYKKKEVAFPNFFLYKKIRGQGKASPCAATLIFFYTKK